MLNWISANEKIVFAGNFNKNYWREKYKNDFEKMTFIANGVCDSDYALAFVANEEKNALTFFYDSQTKIDIAIKNASIDDCADRIISCGCGYVGIDLNNLISVLKIGKKRAAYYGELTVSEIKRLKKYYQSKAGIYLVMHAPSASTLDEANIISAEIAELCDSDSKVLWELLFEQGRSEYSCDLFISEEEISTEKWKNEHRLESEEAYRKYCSNPLIPKDSFMEDGIVDEEKYYAASPKILFIAKEANWYLPNEALDEFQKRALNSSFWLQNVAMGNNTSTMFSNKIALLANAILSNDYINANTDSEVLKKIAFMNLNKRGGFSNCVWKTLEGYVKTYSSYIAQQIELISPDLIVCCGYGVKWLLDKYIQPHGSIKVITVYHPSYFALSYEEYLYQLECAVKNIRWYPQNHVETPKECHAAEIKGIIFDTNKTYSETSTTEMLSNNKISAYGKSSRFIDRFNREDYVFYYVKGRGVVAAGQIISEKMGVEESDEEYKTVRLIVPEQVPLKESDYRAVSAKELREINGEKNFYFASTVKVPYLNKEKSEKLIAVLKEKYI